VAAGKIGGRLHDVRVATAGRPRNEYVVVRRHSAQNPKGRRAVGRVGTSLVLLQVAESVAVVVCVGIGSVQRVEAVGLFPTVRDAIAVGVEVRGKQGG